jgi:molecular chaperone DnaJ
LDGEVSVRLPAGTQPGETLRLAGKGLPRFQGETKGDLLVNIHVHIPEKLSKAERKLFERLRTVKAERTKATEQADSNKK